MAITVNDVKLYRGAKRDQTETAGGLPSGVEVIDGQVNNLFTNIARRNRVKGDVVLEKVFVGINSADNDAYSGAFTAVTDPPFDPNVNVVLFEATGYGDVRADIVDYLESYYQLGGEAGNARLAYGYAAGAEQIMYLLRHYEYNPTYNPDGALNYVKKVDLKNAMEISIGDLVWIGNRLTEEGEYVEIQGLEKVYEAMPDPTARHYYNKVYLAVKLASPTTMAHGIEDTGTFRTANNPAWEAHGLVKVAGAISAGDGAVDVETVYGRIVPVIKRAQSVNGQYVFLPYVLSQGLVVENGGVSVTVTNAEQTEFAEAIVLSGRSVNYTFVGGPAVVDSVRLRFRHQKQWYVSETDEAGLFSGYATGAVGGGGRSMSATLSLDPDDGTVAIVTFWSQHQYAMYASDDLLHANEDQVTETRAIATGLSSYSVELGAGTLTRIRENTLMIYAADESGVYELVSQDDGFGVLGGQLSGTVNYSSRAVSISSFGSVVTRSIRFTYTPDVFRVMEFSIADFSTEDGLTYTINVGASIAPPGSVTVGTEYMTRMSLTWDMWASQTYGMTPSEYTASSGGYAMSRLDGTGYFGIDSNKTVYWHTSSVALPMMTATAINYTDGTISFTLADDRGDALETGITPDAALVGISLRVLTYAGGESNTLPLPLHFGVTGLAPGCVTGTLVTSDGAWAFSDDGLGGLIMDRGTLASPVAYQATGIPSSYVKTIRMSGKNGMIVMTVQTEANSEAGYRSSDGGATWVRVGAFTDVIDAKYGVNNGVAYYQFLSEAHIYISQDSVAWLSLNCPVIGPALLGVGAGKTFVGINPEFGGSRIYVNSDGFATFGEDIFGAISASAGSVAVISAGYDGSGADVIVGVMTGGVSFAGPGSSAPGDWAWGVLPFSGIGMYAMYLQYGNHVWVCAERNGGLAYSDDGIVWNAVVTSFFEPADSNIFGLAVSDDGLFVLVANTSRYTSSDGRTWAFGSTRDEVTNASYYKIEYCNGQFVEVSTDGLGVYTIQSSGYSEAPEVGAIGSVDYAMGEGLIESIEGVTAASSALFMADKAYTSFAVHSNGADPVIPGSLRVMCTAVSGREMTCVGNDATLQLDGDAAGEYNPEHGYAYGEWIEPYYPSTLRVSYGYEAIYHPDFDGMNEKAFPLDGRVPMLKKDCIALIMDRRKYLIDGPIAVDGMAVTLADDAGWPPELPDPCVVQIGDERMTVGGKTGLTLDLSARGYDGTTAAVHADGSVLKLVSYHMEQNPVVSVQHNRIEFANEILHGYSPGAVVASSIDFGDLQAGVGAYHTQSAWNGTDWYDYDTWTGSPADGTYNFTDYPITVTNGGAVTERWLLEVVSSSPLMLDIRGEYLGVVAEDVSCTSTISPINPNTGSPYFILNLNGWGAGWQVGNVIRFNVAGALCPVWAARIVEAKASDAKDDGAEIGIFGDVVA